METVTEEACLHRHNAIDHKLTVADNRSKKVWTWMKVACGMLTVVIGIAGSIHLQASAAKDKSIATENKLLRDEEKTAVESAALAAALTKSEKVTDQFRTDITKAVDETKGLVEKQQTQMNTRFNTTAGDMKDLRKEMQDGFREIGNKLDRKSP